MRVARGGAEARQRGIGLAALGSVVAQQQGAARALVGVGRSAVVAARDDEGLRIGGGAARQVGETPAGGQVVAAGGIVGGNARGRGADSRGGTALVEMLDIGQRYARAGGRGTDSGAVAHARGRAEGAHGKVVAGACREAADGDAVRIDGVGLHNDAAAAGGDAVGGSCHGVPCERHAVVGAGRDGEVLHRGAGVGAIYNYAVDGKVVVGGACRT